MLNCQRLNPNLKSPSLFAEISVGASSTNTMKYHHSSISIFEMPFKSKKETYLDGSHIKSHIDGSHIP